MSKFNYDDKSKVERDLGEVCGPGIMFLHHGIGSASHEDGRQYDLTTMMNGAPAIQSKQTGRTYVFDWQKLLQHAVEHGLIDEQSPEVEAR